MAYDSTSLRPGLRLERVAGRTTFRARGHAKGLRGYFNTETADVALAQARALAWFAAWCGGRPAHSMKLAVALHAASYRPSEVSAKTDFLKRWHAIKDVRGLGKTDVANVTTSYLRAFSAARGNIAGSTAKKDWDTIRPVLRVALAEGWITNLPTFPSTRIVRNPRVPFSRQEWRTLVASCSDADLLDYMQVVVLGLLRPQEALRLTAADIAVDGPRLWIHVRRKTGIAHAPVPMRFPALREVLIRRAATGGRLFPVRPECFPRRFSALLQATGLRYAAGASVRARDSWSLRATGICLEIQRQRRKHGAADYLRIARWAGTSISRIDGHYAAFLAD